MIESHLHTLCALPSRAVGSDGNRAAAGYLAGVLRRCAFDVTCPPFDCLDWSEHGAALHVGGERVDVGVSPYSPGGEAQGALAVADSVEALEALDAHGRVLLVRGALAAEPLMPKNFPFYNPEEHQRIYRALEAARPLAIVAATGRSPMLAGALYPAPLIEDGDFNIPSVYLTEAAGERLARLAGQPAALTIRAERRPAQGVGVIARRAADPKRRVVVMAHFDAKPGIPGALDNAAGAATLLGLAERLASYAGPLTLELVGVNGEDYYSNPGEQQWLSLNAGRMDEIVLGINLDGLGYREGGTAVSYYGLPPALEAAARAAFDAPGFVPGEPWYQGDHSLFVFNQRPAVALTSERAAELMATYIHTPRDTPDLVDPARLAEAAAALHDLITRLT
jgi:aminopeptidase YwaD